MTDKIIELCKEKVRAFRNCKSVTIEDYDNNSSLTLFDTEIEDLITWYMAIKEQESPSELGQFGHFATMEEAQEKLTHCNETRQNEAVIVKIPKE